MSTREALDEADIRQRIEHLVEAIRTMHLDGLRVCFEADTVDQVMIIDQGRLITTTGVDELAASDRPLEDLYLELTSREMP
jgi:hypothetical protein